jgi:hypothetical protein
MNRKTKQCKKNMIIGGLGFTKEEYEICRNILLNG